MPSTSEKIAIFVATAPIAAVSIYNSSASKADIGNIDSQLKVSPLTAEYNRLDQAGQKLQTAREYLFPITSGSEKRDAKPSETRTILVHLLQTLGDTGEVDDKIMEVVVNIPESPKWDSRIDKSPLSNKLAASQKELTQIRDNSVDQDYKDLVTQRNILEGTRVISNLIGSISGAIAALAGIGLWVEFNSKLDRLVRKSPTFNR